MAAASNSRSVRIVPLLIAVWLVGIPAQAKYAGSGMAASAETSTYLFVPDQSKLVQTGGIAGVHWTYSIKGQFQLTVDRDAGAASFAHVDANATDDSPFKRTLDLNHVFNMTSLVGTVEPSGSIKFTGKASDGSDILITVTLTDNLAHLIGQTTPPPNSADFFVFSLDAVAQRKYGGGSGTADNPYQIAAAADLIVLGETPEDYDKHFILTADIDLDPNLPARKVFDRAVIAPATVWNYMGVPIPTGTPFGGVFHGNSHRISHLTVVGADCLGLFGLLSGEVKNLGLVDVNITGSGFVGGLVGSNGSRAIRSGTVSQCYSSGAVNGNWGVGGLVGGNWSAVTQCYSTSAVSGLGVGGLVGYNSSGSVTSCFWDMEASGQATSAGGTGKTTAEMQMASTFLDAGWDFVNVWGIGENQTYPYLRKYSAADINQDASVNFLDLAVLAEKWLTDISHR